MDYVAFETFLSNSATINYNRRTNPTDGNKCSVCLDELDKTHSEVSPIALAIARLPCGHQFHNNCVLKFREEGGTNCPVCRQAISPTYPVCYCCGNSVWPGHAITFLPCCKAQIHLACSASWLSDRHPYVNCEIEKKARVAGMVEEAMENSCEDDDSIIVLNDSSDTTMDSDTTVDSDATIPSSTVIRIVANDVSLRNSSGYIHLDATSLRRGTSETRRQVIDYEGPSRQHRSSQDPSYSSAVMGESSTRRGTESHRHVNRRLVEHRSSQDISYSSAVIGETGPPHHVRQRLGTQHRSSQDPSSERDVHENSGDSLRAAFARLRENRRRRLSRRRNERRPARHWMNR